ncbi:MULTISPECIES: LysE family translocator [unclassified Moraxella]|uniref:LysE family translocator n=1 Tax=unclassified Moraxella TaxID=2685852 RepID=UPI003AF4491C
MTLDNFLWYLLSTCFISATPGSNMILAFQFGLNYGVKKTLWTLAGLSFGLFILLTISLLGLGFINQQAPVLLTVVKVLGALYLGYLGLQAWRHASQPLGEHEQQVIPTPWQLFKTGILVSLSNPKAILFFAAFFPKFINFSAPLAPQYLWLTVGFFAIETTWQLIYTMSGKQLARWLNTGNRLMWLNRLCGGIFIMIAVALIVDVLH